MAVLSLSAMQLDNLLTDEQRITMRLMGLDEAAVMASIQQLFMAAGEAVLNGLRSMDMSVFLATDNGQPTEAMSKAQRHDRWRSIWERAGYPDSHYLTLFPLFREAALPQAEWVRAAAQIRYWASERAAQARRGLLLRMIVAGAWRNHAEALVNPPPSWDEWTEVLEQDRPVIPAYPRSMPEAENAALYRVWERGGYRDDLQALLELAESSGYSFAVVSKAVSQWQAVREAILKARGSSKRSMAR